MVELIDLRSDDNGTPAELVRQVRHIRRLIFHELNQSIAVISDNVFPLLEAAAKTLKHLEDAQYGTEDLDSAVLELLTMETLTSLLAKLIIAYNEVIACIEEHLEG